MNTKFDYNKIFNVDPEAAWKAALVAESQNQLSTLEDFFLAVDVAADASLAEIQEAYRHKLYKHDFAKCVAGSLEYRYNFLKLQKVKEAYRRICNLLQQDPENGLEESKECLLAERDRLLEKWQGFSFGTPSFEIVEEYKNRINALGN